MHIRYRPARTARGCHAYGSCVPSHSASRTDTDRRCLLRCFHTPARIQASSRRLHLCWKASKTRSLALGSHGCHESELLSGISQARPNTASKVLSLHEDRTDTKIQARVSRRVSTRKRRRSTSALSTSRRRCWGPTTILWLQRSTTWRSCIGCK